MPISLAIADAVWERSTHRGAALLVLLALADYANRQGEAWPKIGSLAHKARMSRRYCTALLQQLAESGEITIEPLPRDRRRRLFRLVAFPHKPTGENSSGTRAAGSSTRPPEHNQLSAQAEARNNDSEPPVFDIEARLTVLADLLPEQLPDWERWQQQILDLEGDIEEVEAGLRAIQQQLLGELEAGLDTEEREQIEQQVAQRLHWLRSRLSAEELRFQQRRLFQLEIAERFDLPRLSLFAPALDEVFGP